MVAEWFGVSGRRQLLEEAAWRAGRYVEDVQWRAVSPTRAGLAGLERFAEPLPEHSSVATSTATDDHERPRI
jgi:hypothetical protein